MHFFELQKVQALSHKSTNKNIEKDSLKKVPFPVYDKLHDFKNYLSKIKFQNNISITEAVQSSNYI